MKYLFYFIIILSFKAKAGDTIHLNQNQFFYDLNKSLIVSNMDVDFINSTWTSPKSYIILDQLGQFETEIDNIEIGIPYTVFFPLQNLNFTLYFTELPIITISTPNTIIDAPDVWANFKIIEKDQTFLESNIGIQYRGAWSQTLPKKSLGFKFWKDELGTETENHQLLNLVNEDSWNLQAMYNEPLRIRSKTNNDLWRIINKLHYQDLEPEAINGIRMNYVELFINNKYQGVYCLGEKVKRKQLKLKKHNGNIRGELYKGINWENTTFNTLLEFDNNSLIWGGYEYKHPKEETNWENLYNLIDFVINATDDDFYQDYKSKFEIDNLVDYYIFINLLRATDNRGKNLYIAKYNKSGNYFFVPWDLDGTFGIIWDGSTDTTTNDLLSNGLYDRLQLDCDENGFKAKLKAKWLALRQSIITNESLINLFISNHNFLKTNGVYERESLVWNDFTYDYNNLNYISTWIESRLVFLDDMFTQDCENLSNDSFSKSNEIFKLYPNPTKDFINIISENESNYNIFIYNNLGQLIFEEKSNSFEKQINLSHLKKGFYIFKIESLKYNENYKIILN